MGLTVARAEAVTLPATPQPAECTIAAIGIGELEALVTAGTPAAASTAAVTSLSNDDFTSIEGTIEQSVACVNANQPLQALALFTNRYLVARFSGDGADDLGHLAAAATRSPAPAAPADRLAIDSIGEPALLPDGRVSVVVMTSNSRASFTDVIILEKRGDEWAIDEAHAVDPAAATPTSEG